jgi:glycosyltransferase involved in cell wall biosynthesis
LPRFADQVITVDDLRRRFCLEAGVKANRLRLIPNGADVEFFRPGEKDRGLLSEWGLAERRVVLYSGKVNHSYDFHNVIEAIREVVRRRADVSLLIVGAGSALPDMKDLSARLGLAGHVVFAGYRPFAEIPGLIRAAEVCVYPLRSVAALSIFEYMACAKPVVLPNADYDLSLPEGSCLAVQKSPAGFAGGISRLLADPDLSAQIGKKARGIVEQQFNWDHLALAYEVALIEAVKGRSARG